MLIGDRVRHLRTGETGTVVAKNSTCSPITRRESSLLTIYGDDGKTFIESASQVELLSKEKPHANH